MRANATPMKAAEALRAGDVRDALMQIPRLPAVTLLLFLLVALFAPLITPHDPIQPNLLERNAPPAFLPGGDMKYILGTDLQGRDLLSRMIMGAQVSLSAALLAILIGGVVGTSLGLAAGYLGGWVDVLIMRCVDLMLAFPSVLLALIFAINVGPSFWVVVGVIGLILWARYARLVRGETLSIRERDYVALAARVTGCSTRRIMLLHLLPNLAHTIIILSTLQVGSTILMEASLSFLGAGVPPPNATWGGMVNDGRQYIATFWWISMFPGLAIMLVVLSFNLVGDWLRDYFDPKLREL